MTSTAPLLVLTDPHLLPRIGAFTSGVPFALVDFWRQYKPENELTIKVFLRQTERVVEKLVQYGTIRLLELATQVAIPDKVTKQVARQLDIHFAFLEKRLALSYVAKYAAQYRRPEMLHWGIVNEFDTAGQGGELWKMVVRQFRDGDTPLLDVLKEHIPISEKDMLDHISSKSPTMELVLWLDQHVAMPKVMSWIAESAASAGDLEVVQFLLGRGVQFHCDKWIFENLEEHGRWEMLAFLLERDLIAVKMDSAMDMILNKEEPVQQLVRRFASKFKAAFAKQARKQVKNDYDSELAFLLKNDAFTIDFPISIDGFAAHQNLEVIMLLHEKGLANATTEAMDIAAEKRYWDIVEFLHENRSEGCTTRAMDAAAQWGNLKYVKLLNENRSGGCTTAAMDQAASQGYMAVLRYLHENTTVGCTTAAMDGAVWGGHLDIVKFLVENRSEGCTTAAMDRAAKVRDLAMLRYLHENSIVGCTTDAMDRAAQNGHLDVVKFLHEHRHEGCTVAAINEAAAYGHLDVVRYLHGNRHEGCTVDAVKMALRYSQQKIVAFLYEKYPQLFGPEILHEVLLRGAFDLFMELQGKFPEQANAVVGDVAFQAGAEHELPTIRFIINVLKREDVVCRIVEGALSKEEHKRPGHWWLQAIATVTGQTSGALIVKEQPHPFVAVRRASSWQPSGAVVAKEPLHPFLLDPRAPSWAISYVLGRYDKLAGPYASLSGYRSWPMRAVHANDVRLLELLRDTPPESFPQRAFNGVELRPEQKKWELTFEYSRAVAVRANNLPILRWLLEKVDLPIEPTLLSEAVFLHRYEIAEWLVANCPEACRESNWTRLSWKRNCGLDDDLLHWLETHPSVRAALDFGSIIDWAVEKDNATGLQKLFEWCPELVLSRLDLVAKVKKDGAVPEVLREIGYTSAQQIM